MIPGLDATTVLATVFGYGVFVFGTSILTAAVGLFVAYQAFRGYRRNASRAMLFIAIGIFFLTSVPFVLTYSLTTVSAVDDAAVVLVRTISNVVGLSAILYALTGA
jgi:hypothetical protein